MDIKLIENMVINEKSEIYPFHSFYEMSKYLKILQEAYSAIEPNQIEEMLINISQALENCDINFVNDLLVKNNIKIHVNDQGEYVQDAHYNAVTKEINLFINRKCLKHIVEFKNIPFIKNQIERIFTHEDTHRQQDIASNGKFTKGYKALVTINDVNKNKEITKEYFNQTIEIDAYARQFGCELKNSYPEETIDQLFKRIFDRNIEDEFFKYYLETIHTQLSVKNQKHFLCTLYEYLRDELGIKPY